MLYFAVICFLDFTFDTGACIFGVNAQCELSCLNEFSFPGDTKGVGTEAVLQQRPNVSLEQLA